MKTLRQILITTFCVALISACSSGGGSDSNPPVTTSGPAAINLTNMPTITSGVVSAMFQTSEFDDVLAGGGVSGGLFGKVRPGDGFSNIAGSLLAGWLLPGRSCHKYGQRCGIPVFQCTGRHICCLDGYDPLLTRGLKARGYW